jgi:hypothetical protein
LALPEVPLDGDEAITADREETKYLISHERVEHLAAAFARRLSAHRYVGKGANGLPDPHHFVTTAYFDTPTRAHFRIASAHPESNVKLRAKEYYDLHPSLAELATDPAEIVRYQPWLWIELKRRNGCRTEKRRVRLRKEHVPAFLGGDYALAELDYGRRARGDWELVVSYCEGLAEPLSPSCVVNYRRLCWQDERAALRITLDVDLAIYAVPSDLWTRQIPLVRSTLGVAVEREEAVLVEVKRRGALPDWIGDTLERAGARSTRFSKFLRASQAVFQHG